MHDINSIITYVSGIKGYILHSFSVIVFLIILSLLFAAFMLVLGKIFAPKEDSKIKNSVYECGMQTFQNDKILLNPQYFVIALIFLVYVAETMLLFPFALAFESLKMFVFFEAFIFLSIMMLSLAYAIQKNMLRFR